MSIRSLHDVIHSDPSRSVNSIAGRLGGREMTSVMGSYASKAPWLLTALALSALGFFIWKMRGVFSQRNYTPFSERVTQPTHPTSQDFYTRVVTPIVALVSPHLQSTHEGLLGGSHEFSGNPFQSFRFLGNRYTPGHPPNLIAQRRNAHPHIEGTSPPLSPPTRHAHVSVGTRQTTHPLPPIGATPSLPITGTDGAHAPVGTRECLAPLHHAMETVPPFPQPRRTPPQAVQTLAFSTPTSAIPVTPPAATPRPFAPLIHSEMTISPPTPNLPLSARPTTPMTRPGTGSLHVPVGRRQQATVTTPLPAPARTEIHQVRFDEQQSRPTHRGEEHIPVGNRRR